MGQIAEMNEIDLSSLQTVADQLAAREDALGGLPDGCPSSEEMRAVVTDVAKWLAAGDEDGLTVSNTWEIVQRLAYVSDKWTDQNDPIGAVARERLEEIIQGLNKVLSDAMPALAETQRKWQDLRQLEHVLKRRLSNAPPFISISTVHELDIQPKAGLNYQATGNSFVGNESFVPGYRGVKKFVLILRIALEGLFGLYAFLSIPGALIRALVQLEDVAYLGERWPVQPSWACLASG